MNAHLKPYRLISAQELQSLAQRIDSVLNSWNNEYAMHPINSHLTKASIQPIQRIKENALLLHTSQPLALLEGDYLALIKTSLFADEASCYNDAAELLFSRLIGQLFALSPESLQTDHHSTDMQEWFYPGAPGLVVTLNVASLPSNTAAPSSNAAAPSSNAAAPSSNAAAPSSNATAPSSNATAPSSNAAAPSSNAAAPSSNAAAPSSPTSRGLSAGSSDIDRIMGHADKPRNVEEGQLPLNNNTHRVTLYLHPAWVLTQLTPINQLTKPLSPLSDAFSNQVLHLSVELETLRLSTTQLLHLQVGDVIQTDQPLALTCWLKHQHQTLCQAEIGQMQEHKSIQLSRSL